MYIHIVAMHIFPAIYILKYDTQVFLHASCVVESRRDSVYVPLKIYKCVCCTEKSMYIIHLYIKCCVCVFRAQSEHFTSCTVTFMRYKGTAPHAGHALYV